MKDAIETEQQIADLSARTADSQLGLVTDADWPNGVVTVVFADGVRQTMKWDGDAPWAGDTVLVSTLARRPSCRAVWPAPIGTVQSVAGSIATVLLDDDTLMDRPFIGVVPGAGDRVHVSHAGRIITGVYSAEPPGSEFITPTRPPVVGGRQSLRFVAIGSGNYRGSSYQGQVLEISDSRSAYVFYGTQVRDSIPASARNLNATLMLSENWDQVPATPSKLGTHGSSGGVPPTPPGISLGGALNVFDGGAIDVGSLIPQFRAGTAFGFGFPAGQGWRQFAALPDLLVSFDL